MVVVEVRRDQRIAQGTAKGDEGCGARDVAVSWASAAESAEKRSSRFSQTGKQCDDCVMVLLRSGNSKCGCAKVASTRVE